MDFNRVFSRIVYALLVFEILYNNKYLYLMDYYMFLLLIYSFE